MKNVTLFLAFLFIFSFNVLAQTEYSNETDLSEKTKKVDEFGKASSCDLSARVDNFFIEINNNPNSKGYIIVYNGKDFLPADYESKMFEKRIRQQIGFRKYDPEAVVFIDGGFRETVTTEFFLVPENGEIPTPTETVDKPVIPTDKTFLFDKTHVYFNNEYDIYGGINEEDEFLLPSVKARLEAERIAREEEWAREKNLEEPNEIDSNEAAYEQTENPEEISEDYKPTAEEIEEAKYSWAKENFGEMIEKQKDSRGVIVFYADDQYYDVSKLQARFEEGKQLIAKKSGISPNKMEIIFGGYRDNIQLEFWIVPKKGKNPTPSPQERKIEDENTFFNQP